MYQLYIYVYTPALTRKMLSAAMRLLEPAMNFRISIVLVLAFAGVAFAAPHPKFTRTDAHARLSTVLAARATSGTECVACEDVLGEVTRQPPPPPSCE